MTRQTTTAVPSNVWTADEIQYRLYDNFDPTTPPGWEEEAIERVWDEWVEPICEFSTFWSRVFVTAIILIVAAALGLSSR